MTTLWSSEDQAEDQAVLHQNLLIEHKPASRLLTLLIQLCFGLSPCKQTEPELLSPARLTSRSKPALNSLPVQLGSDRAPAPTSSRRAPLTLARLRSLGSASAATERDKTGAFLRRDPTDISHCCRSDRAGAEAAERRRSTDRAPRQGRGSRGESRCSEHFRHDATQRAGTTPTAVSPLSLRPRLHRKMAFEQRAIFPRANELASPFQPRKRSQLAPRLHPKAAAACSC